MLIYLFVVQKMNNLVKWEKTNSDEPLTNWIFLEIFEIENSKRKFKRKIVLTEDIIKNCRFYA